VEVGKELVAVFDASHRLPVRRLRLVIEIVG
jgi:hypothetical protein